jgi:tetratricopeptide (TPR) repeat protein
MTTVSGSCRMLLLRWPAGLILGVALAADAAGPAQPDPAAPLDRAMAAAESQLRAGDLIAADTGYREALFEGWLLKAALERLEGRWPEARDAVRQAAVFGADRREASLALALAALQAGDGARAVEILTPIASHDPSDSEVLRLLAKALAATGEVERALATLDQAVASVPDDPELKFLLAAEYLWLGRADVAERLFEGIVASRPIPQVRVLIGRSYRDAGQYARAARELRAALAQDPSVRRAHYYLGMVLMVDATNGADRVERAIAEFREELKLAPQDPLANDQLGVALLEAGRSAEALPPLEAAVHGEERAPFVSHLARCLLALERPADAARAARRALELAGEQQSPADEREKMHYQLALALRKLGQTQEAAEHFAAARELATGRSGALDEPATGDVAARSAEAVARAARDPSALPDLPRARRLELAGRVKQALARASFNLGVLQSRSERSESAPERFARAAAFFEQAAAVDPEFPQVQASWGVACFNARQFDAAIPPLERALAATPADAGLRRMLALACLNTGSYPKAAELLRGDPGRSTDPALQQAYALALVKSGAGAEAEGVLLALIAGQDDSAELRSLLGEAYAQQDKHEAARRQFEAAREIEARSAKEPRP